MSKSELKYRSTRDLKTSSSRLTTLANYLKKQVTKDRFNLDTFFDTPRSEYGTPEELKIVKSEIKEGFCGTTACAIGHACMIPEFNKAGLKIRIVRMNIEYPSNYIIIDDEYSLSCSYKNKRDDVLLHDFDAAQAFFKISEKRADKLFSYVGYGNYNYDVSKSEVVKAITRYVNRVNKELAKRDSLL